MNDFPLLPQAVHTLCVYDKLKKNELLRAFRRLCSAFEKKASLSRVCEHYSAFCSILYCSEFQGNLTDYLLDLLLSDHNAFTEAVSTKGVQSLPACIVKAAEQDLQTLYTIAMLPSSEIKELIRERYPEHTGVSAMLPDYQTGQQIHPEIFSWTLGPLAAYHRQNGTGIFAKYHAFYFSDRQTITPIPHPRQVRLDALKKYELQKQRIVDNTKSFLAGKPAGNVLLYGDRGTGKSTMVNAILTEYGDQRLRMIQIAKEDLLYLHQLIAAIRSIPLYFIVFIDDLTFGENDPAFNTMKAVLEGSLDALPANVLIYATTNRRHLIKETFSAREGNELHASDTRDESASLADRFGLCLTFMKPTLQEYLDIVCAIAKDRELPIDETILKTKASTFATRKGSRSGRVARQFIDELESRIALQLPI